MRRRENPPKLIQGREHYWCLRCHAYKPTVAFYSSDHGHKWCIPCRVKQAEDQRRACGVSPQEIVTEEERTRRADAAVARSRARKHVASCTFWGIDAKRSSAVYAHVDPPTGEIVYCGKSVTPGRAYTFFDRRQTDHMNFLWEATQKYKMHDLVVPLALELTDTEAGHIETQWIDAFVELHKRMPRFNLARPDARGHLKHVHIRGGKIVVDVIRNLAECH